MLPQKKIQAYVESFRIPPYKENSCSEPPPPRGCHPQLQSLLFVLQSQCLLH